MERVEQIASNENLVLCKRRTSNQKIPDVYEFLGFTKTIGNKAVDFSLKSPKINGLTYLTSNNSIIGCIPKDSVYGIQQDLTPYFKNGRSVLFQLKITYKLKNSGKVPLIVGVDEDHKLAYYQGIDINGIADSIQTLETAIVIPSFQIKNPKWFTYIYNPDKNSIEIFDYQYSLKTTGK